MKHAIAATLTGCAVLALASSAVASGDYGPGYTQFKAWTAPDIPRERFQAGELGVLQPGMRRVYLYTAWRAIVLGPKVAQAPGLAGGLARADGSVFKQGWEQVDNTSYDALKARTAAVLHQPADSQEVRRIVACAPAATDFAAKVLAAASARKDATPARLDAWTLAQLRVAEACHAADDWRYRYGNEKPPELPAPAPLADSEPLYWRQVNDYQRAAFHFQARHYADSAALFERIGATPGHPMRELGAYLALRAGVRGAAVEDVRKIELARREEQVRILVQRADAILADASLAAMHEPARALMRAARAALIPEIRLQELTRYLDDPQADPFQLDRLGDWSVLMDDAKVQDLRAGHEFVDWIETVRGCTGLEARPECAVAGAHALERWQEKQSRSWLVAALMLAESAPPVLIKAAMAVQSGDPAYLTVRYHLARLLRLAGQAEASRAIADAVLQRPLSPGTRNLFREERFAVATSVRDAGSLLLRTNVDYLKMSPDGPSEEMVNADGELWLNRGLPVADLIELAGLESLPKPLRARIAGAAWIRAALLERHDEGRRAAALFAQLVPEGADAAARYAGAGTNAERRHAVLVASLRFGLAAEFTMFIMPIRQVDAADATASAWCSFKPPQEPYRAPGMPWRLPAMPDTGHAAQARGELATLAPSKTATGTLGDDVMQWAASHPDDPELPWLLHVVVMSTRGGCLDPDAKALSRRAHALLHKRYAGSEWARQTPYYY